MTNQRDFGKALRQALKLAKIKPKELADELGVLPQHVNNWQNRGIPAKYAILVAKLLNVEPDQISDLAHTSAEPNLETGKRKLKGLLAEVQKNDPPTESESVLIPQVDITASLGNGNGFNTESVVIDHWPVEKKLLLLDGVEPENAVIVLCEGDSMYPNICHGDLVVIDKGAKGVPWDGVYAIQTDTGIRIKRISVRLDNTVEISSDSDDKKRFPTEIYDADEAQNIIRPLGRVVRKFWGRVN